MTRGVRLLLASVALVLACNSGSPRPSEDAPAAPVAAPEAKAPDPIEPAPVAEPIPKALELPGPPVFSPGPFEFRLGQGAPLRPTKAYAKVDREEGDMRDHAWAFGWTADGSAFAHCTVISGAVCKLCDFTRLDGTSETLASGDECESPRLSEEQLEARLAERGVAVRDVEWAHGGEWIVTAREVQGPPDDEGQARSILEVGTEGRDGSPGARAWRENGCPKDASDPACFVDAHVEALLPSPDGASVAILGHFWEGEFSDTFTLAIVPAGRLVAESYNRRGLDALAREDFEAAAKAFLAAMHADASAWKGPYNLACAYARAADPRAEPALRAAVERGGETVRAKAKKDRDLDGVRSQEWFSALIGPAP